MHKSFISGLVVLFLCTLLANKAYSQDDTIQSLRLMFYNVENLFDTYDDTLKDDNEFLPDGIKRWNYARYIRKINSLYKTIIAAGEWDPPVIIALSEVENRKVIDDLVYGTCLSKYKYKIIHEESPDQRGIDVCLIYRNDCALNIDYRYWVPSGIKAEDFTSRSILYAKFKIGTDTIHFFVNHWPSRRGGVLAGEDLRLKIALMERAKVDSILKESKHKAKIIIMGDFNCTPDDQEIKSLIINPDSGIILKNLSESLYEDGFGTYRYKGTWEMIDQVIVSEMLLSCKKGLFIDTKMVAVFKPEFLLRKDPEYPGFSPWPTYRGYRYQGGYSDHLPVLMDLKFR